MTKIQRSKEILSILTELYPNPLPDLDYTHDYEFLFAVIMSAQTTDKQINKLTSTLFVKYPNLESFANADLDILIKDMSSIGLYRAKAKNLVAAAKMLIQDFDSKVPSTIEEITLIPGAARKTANVVIADLFNQNVGIAVDTHVIRLSNNFGLTKHQDPIKIESDLKKLFPKSHWGKMSLRIILYGRYYYPARSINHEGPLSHLVVKDNQKTSSKKTKLK
jgi:endonuclease III